MLEQLQSLFMSMLQLVLSLLNPVILIPAIIIIIVLVKKNKEYKSGSYYQVTKQSYLSVRHNTGRYGEYLIYKYLKHMELNGAKFLFNVYIPKGNGDTTEIDVLIICPKGIFVIESKNYSGWIFGSENSKNWYQTLPAGRGRSHKEHFYNPIMQNHTHIKHLKSFLGEQFPMRSIIVFSDRCTLKSVQITSNDISVINRYNVAPVLSTICNQTPTDILSESDITELYNKLYPFTQIDEITKAQHIANIRNSPNGQLVRHSTPEHTPSVVAVLKTEVITVGVEAVAEDTQSPVAESPEQISVKLKATENQIPKCPRCNGNLVLRTATKGVNAGNQFYGCSNYPKCKYIQNITNKTV